MTMYVITHKKYDYPVPSGYQSLLVGANKNIGLSTYLRDNTGNNISDKNKSYCELTGLYWIWKNKNDRNVGLSHYRRYFSNYTSYKSLDYAALIFGKNISPISINKLDGFLEDYDWIVTTPEVVEEGSIRNHYDHCHHIADLETVGKVIKELTPEYFNSFEEFISGDKAPFLNMFYTSKKEMDAYCAWAFKILFEVEKRVDISKYDSYQQRLFGFLGERLLNVWLVHRKPKIKYLATYNSDVVNRKWAAREIKHKIIGWN